MTAVAHSYRVRVYVAGDDNTVDFDLALDDISGPPVVTGLITRPTTGRTEMRPFTVLAIDNDGTLTAALTEQSGGFGRWQALGRRVDVQFSQDGGAFTTYGSGRISRLDEADGPGRYRIEISDESWLARKAEIFRPTATGPNTTQLWPAGVKGDWRGFQAAGTAQGSDLIGPNPPIYQIRVSALDRKSLVTSQLVRFLDELAIAQPVVPQGGAIGLDTNNFGPLRLNYAGVDYPVVSFHPLATSNDLLYSLERVQDETFVGDDPLNRIFIWFVAATAPPASGLVFLHAPDSPPTEDLPLHIGLADAGHDWGTSNGWIHPATLTRRVWDEVGVRYDNASLSALEADGTLPQLAPRVTEQVDNAERWLEDHVWGPCMLIALRGPNGVRKLIDMRLPQDLDPDTLPMLDATNTRATTWRLLGNEAVNSIIWKYLHHSQPPLARRAFLKGGDPAERGPHFSDAELDGFVVEEREIEPIERDTIDEIGRRSLKLKLLGSLEPTTAPTRTVYIPTVAGSNFIEVTKTISSELLDIFQDGAYKIVGQVSRSVAEPLTEGDLVIIDLGSIGLPNPASGARSDLRLVRLMSITRHPAHAEVEFLDLGPKAQPLAAPTIDVQFLTGPRRVEVTISNIPAGATANLEFAYTDSSSEPTVWPIRRTNLGNGTITFRDPPGDGFAHARVRTAAPNRIRSVWVTDFAALNTVAKIIDASLAIDGAGVPTIALEASSATLGIRLRFSLHKPNEDPVYGPPSDHSIADFPLEVAGVVVAGSQALSVSIEPWTGFSGGTVTGTAGDIFEVSTDRQPVDLTLTMRATVLDLVAGVSATIRVAVADSRPQNDITLAYEQSGTGNITPGSPQTILADDVTSELTTTGFLTFDVDLANTPGQVTFTATSPGRNPASQTVGFAAPGQDGEPGDDASQGPRVAWIRNFGGTVTTDAAVGLEHSDNDGGLLEVWVNPSGTGSPDPDGPADGSVAIASTPFIADDATVFGGAGRLLNNIPVSGLADKTIYARFTDSQSRVAWGSHVLKGIIDVVDPFGILASADPEGLVENLALKLVTNQNVGDRAISFRNLVIGSYDNLINDPSFEAAGEFGGGDDGLSQADWPFNISSGGIWSTTDTNPFAGTFACIYSRSGQTGNAFLGTAQGGPGAGARAISASEGDRHYLQARARMSGSGSGGQVRVQIRYTDIGGNQLALHNSDLANLTFSYQVVSVTVPENQAAPANTAHVQFRLVVENAGTIDNILWDDCFARLMVDGTLIVDGAILAKHVSAGSITTPKLAAKAATFEKVSIGSLGNMIPDPIFSSGDLDTSDWTVASDGGGVWAIGTGSPKVGNFSARYNRSAQTNLARLRHAALGMEATEGDEFFFRCFAGTTSGTGSGGVAIVFRASNGSIIGAFTDIISLDTTYALSQRSATAPAGTARVDFELRAVNSGTATIIKFDDCYAQHKVDGNLYVDGSITAKAIDVLDIEVGQHIQSIDYVAGTSGWFIGFDGSDDGFAEFSNVVVRGTIDAGSVVAASSFTADQIIFSGGTSDFTIDLSVSGQAQIDAGANQLLLQSTSTSDLEIVSTDSRINLNATDGVRVNFPGVGIRTLEVGSIGSGESGTHRMVQVLN